MMFIWSCIILSIPLHDPERILPRAAEALNESMQYLTSYQNSVTFGPQHDKLVRIMDKLEKLERELTVII
jgi:hypothetical protein